MIRDGVTVLDNYIFLHSTLQLNLFIVLASQTTNSSINVLLVGHLPEVRRPLNKSCSNSSVTESQLQAFCSSIQLLITALNTTCC